jgi:hypothetical protein
MNINLTITVDHPEELPRVLQYLARSFETAPATTAPIPGTHDASVLTPQDARPAKPRGRPAKATPAAAEEFKDITPQPAERVAAVSADAPTLEKKDVQKLLIAVVQKHGAAACGAICRKYGAPNLSGFDDRPEVYGPLAADARALLETEAVG